MTCPTNKIGRFGNIMFVITVEKPYKDISQSLRRMKPSLMGRLFTIRIFRKKTVLICNETKDYRYLKRYFESLCETI